VLSVSCDSDEVEQEDLKKYFPIRVGSYFIYDIERVEYTFGNPSENKYQLKIQVVDTIENLKGVSVYRLYRFTRENETDDWSYLDTWALRDERFETVLDQGNLSTVVLTYPLRKNLRWNGNQYNNLTKEYFYVQSVDEEFTYKDFHFDNCVTVIQSDEQDKIVQFNQRKEIYAQGIGLVYKDSTLLNYCTQPHCLGNQQIESGVIATQVLREYGVE
jgi:hypothetical protein